MATSVRFFGAAGYEVVGPTHRLLIDPYLTGNPGAPVSHEDLDAPDLILVTHAAYDHMGDAAAIAKRTGAPIVCGRDVSQLLQQAGVPLSQIRATIWGAIVEVAGFVVRPVECHHWSIGELSDGTLVTGFPLAFIVETEPGVRIYHYGDTAIFDMTLFGELYEPTIGIFGCATPEELEDEEAGRILTGEMDGKEAAMAADMLRVKVAIASHYIDPTDDVHDFMRRVPEHDSTGRRIALAPLPGETIVFEVENGEFHHTVHGKEYVK